MTDATVLRMGVWPPGAGLQGQAPNHPMLLRLRASVVSDGEKTDLIRQVGDEKTSKREPLMTHRKRLSRCQNGFCPPAPGLVWTSPAYGPYGSRCIGGVSSSQASIRNMGTWLGLPRESHNWPQPRGRIPMPRTGAEQRVVAMKEL